MRRPKIYLDTSVISHLDAPDAPEKQEDTRRLWAEIKRGRYTACISERVLAEIADSDEPKRSAMLERLASIEYTTAQPTDGVTEYAKKLIEEGVITDKHFDDCLHIAYAAVSECDMIISWNFKHIVRAQTINGVRYISALLGYRDMGIYSPSMVIQGED